MVFEKKQQFDTNIAQQVAVSFLNRCRSFGILFEAESPVIRWKDSNKDIVNVSSTRSRFGTKKIQ